MSRPDVSVIIAAWNAASCIERAASSALDSEGLNVQVVIVDDASTDGTPAVIRRLAAADPRIVTNRLAVNSGPSVARNRAIELSNGRYIAVLDADDAILPRRLARLVAVAECGYADIVVDNMRVVDANGGRDGVSRFLRSEVFQMSRSIDLETWVAFNNPMQRGDCLGYLKPVILRETLQRLGAAYDPDLRNSEDYYLIADLLAQGARMAYSPSDGYLYTRAPGSTSHRLKPAQTRAWLDAEARFIDRHGERLRPLARHALMRRARALRHADQLVRATDALKGRRFLAFLKLLASDLESAAYTLATFARVGAGKLLNRKPA